MVSSGLRRDIWAGRRFSEELQYAEDDEYTRWARASGYAVVYCPESVVMHSHNYTPDQSFRRSFGDARALAASWQGRPGDFNFFRTVLLGWLNDFHHDVYYCAKTRRWRELPHASRIRWHQRRGKLHGFKTGWKDYRSNENSHSEQPVPAPLRGRV